MSSEFLQRYNCVDPAVVDSFARRIETFSTSLSSAERAQLEAIIIAVMEPHDRMSAREATDLLDDEEEKILREIESEIRQFDDLRNGHQR